MRMCRRGLLAGLAAFAAAAPAAAKSREIGKAFPYLEAYLELPPAERSRFSLAYYLGRDGQPAEGMKVWLADGAAKTPLTVGARGRVERLPTLAQLRSESARVVFDVPDKAKLSLNLQVEPNVCLAPEMDAVELALAVAQAAKGARKAAGLVGFAVPKFDKVVFVRGGGGQAVFADGRVRALPVEKGAAVFEPAALKGAVKLRFAATPERMLIA